MYEDDLMVSLIHLSPLPALTVIKSEWVGRQNTFPCWAADISFELFKVMPETRNCHFCIEWAVLFKMTPNGKNSGFTETK